MIKQRLGIFYISLPYKRKQDVILVKKSHKYGLRYTVSLVDGWSNNQILRGNTAGLNAAKFIAKEYPKIYISTKIKDDQIRAQVSAKKIEQQLLSMYPAHVSATGAWLFCFEEYDCIVSVGSMLILEWVGNYWKKISGINSYPLNPTKYPSDTARFFGRGELKVDPLYSYIPETTRIDRFKPLLIATDGLEKMMTVTEINRLTNKTMRKDSHMLLSVIQQNIVEKSTQKDDITIMFRYREKILVKTEKRKIL